MPRGPDPGNQTCQQQQHADPQPQRRPLAGALNQRIPRRPFLRGTIHAQSFAIRFGRRHRAKWHQGEPWMAATDSGTIG